MCVCFFLNNLKNLPLLLCVSQTNESFQQDKSGSSLPWVEKKKKRHHDTNNQNKKKKDYKVCVAACVNVLTKQLELIISSNQVVNLRWNRFVINVF